MDFWYVGNSFNIEYIYTCFLRKQLDHKSFFNHEMSKG
jgi:hypothetical protein